MKKRIITGVIGGAAFLSIVWLGSYWFIFLIYLLATGTYFEYARMRKSPYILPVGLINYILLLLLLGLGYWNDHLYILYQIWMAVIFLLILTVFSKNRLTIEDISYQLFGAIYIGIGFHFMLSVRMEYGLEWLLLAIACVWATDTGAYFGGRLWGKRKLWPSISPNKTIEGAISGTLISIGVALLFYYFGAKIETIYAAIILGFVIALVGQIGDLIESAIKRYFNIKDSGQILPGHGGFFDRFDSMIAVFPVVYMLIHWV